MAKSRRSAAFPLTSEICHSDRTVCRSLPVYAGKQTSSETIGTSHLIAPCGNPAADAAALTSLSEELEHEAEAVVERLCGKGRFCATRELATHLPVTIVSNAIGLPEEGRERMMEWSIGLFNCIGPMNERARNAMPVLSEMMHYARTQAVPGKLKPGSWAEAIHHAAAAGEVPSEAVPVMMIDYMGPSLDTTIFGISSGVWLFANHSDQWDLVRNDPSLIPAAINEILRMEAPIQDFSRYVARDYDLDGVSLPEGSRAIIFYGAANRDPREHRWLVLFCNQHQACIAACHSSACTYRRHSAGLTGITAISDAKPRTAFSASA
jgi:hypothetical protein